MEAASGEGRLRRPLVSRAPEAEGIGGESVSARDERVRTVGARGVRVREVAKGGHVGEVVEGRWEGGG